jgi:PAB1-binding protein PBP1
VQFSQDSLSPGPSIPSANSKPREVRSNFGENERQPGGIKIDYDEVIYTLHIDKDDPEYKAREAAVETQAEQSMALNSNVAEKRVSEHDGAGDIVAGKET